MKKLLCALLALSFAFTFGCAKTDDSSAAGSAAESTDGTSADASEISEAMARIAAIDSILKNDTDRTSGSSNLLGGLSYSSSREPNSEYPDTERKILTDGLSPTGFSDQGLWVGFYGARKGDEVIDFDLGSEKEGISDFTARVLVLHSYGIAAARRMTVSVAGEDKNYVDVGVSLLPDDLGASAYYDHVVRLQGSVTARYIRYTFSEKTATWFFLGEISAVAYGEEYDGADDGSLIKLDKYYGLPGITAPSAPEYYPESEEGYNETRNLISGMTPVYADATETITSDLATDWYNSKSFRMLTDGSLAGAAAYSDGGWFHITRGGTRSFVYDLGKTVSVEGFAVGLLRDTDVGVKLPRYLRIFVSENGTEWQTVFLRVNVSVKGGNTILRLDEKLSAPVRARFVKLSFMCDVHTYIDEFTVTGKKNAQNAAPVTPDDPNGDNPAELGYIKPEAFDNVHNMLLSYHCLPGNGPNGTDEAGMITPEQYLPYVAYLDKDGNITDTFFDAYLYLPYTRFNYSDEAKSADGWRTYVNDIYEKDRNMDALEKCVGDVYSQLGVDEKVKVYTSVLYTFTTVGDGKKNEFGDIDGDGKNEDFSNIADRKKAIKWIMDEELNRFNGRNYKNLEFCGFYWFEEAIDYSDPDEAELIAYAADYAHKLGKKLFWIPYYQASGYSEWQELGFDLASMQPNYMFSKDATNERLYVNADLTKMLGMCVEMEINNPEDPIDAARYREYMIAGAQTGYMNSVKIYYTNGIPGAFYTTCYSKDDATRALYDDTYAFAKGEYKVFTEKDFDFDTNPASVNAENGVWKGQIDVGNAASAGGRLVLEMSPRYGSVRLNCDGKVVYTAPAGYKGSDSFAVSVDVGYCRSETRIITVNID